MISEIKVKIVEMLVDTKQIKLFVTIVQNKNDRVIDVSW